MWRIKNKDMKLQSFNYEINQIRTVEINGEIWFVAVDICKVLEINNVTDALSRLDEDEKNTLVLNEGIRGNPNLNIISESGFYSLVLSSRKAEAKAFKKWVTSEVLPSIRKTGSYGKETQQLPNFYLRYVENLHNIDKNYFSVISELFITIHAEFEKIGYKIPNRAIDGKQLMPDISVGKTFADYLKNVKSEFYGKHKLYNHAFPNSKTVVEAKMYPVEALPTFRKFIYEKWIPEYAQKYFDKRDPKALEHLPKLLK